MSVGTCLERFFDFLYLGLVINYQMTEEISQSIKKGNRGYDTHSSLNDT